MGVDYLCPTEDAEQRHLVNLLARVRPDVLFFSVPNGGWRNKVTAAKLKATGVRPGVPDLVIPEPRRGYHGLFIELKRSKGGQVSQYQKQWLASLRAKGYKAEVCAGADAAWDVITEYLKDS
jgi:hypothetical protein